MIKIGFFSKLSQVPVKTLRYYDQIGLLNPVEIDTYSGYRYYSVTQLPRINRILALKDLGLSLDQIAQLLAEDLPVEELRGMLRMKQVEIREKMQQEEEKLARVAARLKQIEQESEMSEYDVVIKTVDDVRIASVRDLIPTYPEQGHLWDELEGVLAEKQIKPTGPCFTLYHSDEPEVDTEVCEPVNETKLPGDETRVVVRELSGTEVAALIHHGPYAKLGTAYEALVKWIEENGYRIADGPYREIYLQPADQASQNDEKAVTEIQFPVVKA